MLVYKGAHKRIPQHIHKPHDEKHEGRGGRSEAEHVGIEQQQIHANGLIDKVLSQIARPKAYALQPIELIEAVRLVVSSVYFHNCYR